MALPAGGRQMLCAHLAKTWNGICNNPFYMKSHFNMKKTYLFLFVLLFTSLFMTRCTYQYFATESHYDRVKNEKRLEFKMYFLLEQERNDSHTFISAETDLLKRINSRGNVSYRTYNRLRLAANSFPVNDTLYILLNGKPWKEVMRDKRAGIYHHTKTEKKEVHKADSTAVVVSSEIQEFKEIQFEYPVSPALIQAILQADSMSFRYYSGPEMHTLKVSGWTLRKLKKFISESGH